jgi:hypothetical protein
MMGILAFNSIYPTTTLAVFHTNLYIFSEMLTFSNLFFAPPPSNKKILKENIEHSRKFFLVEMIFHVIYLFDKQFLKLATKVCSFLFLN